jgi:hypothetical protein
MTREQDTAKKIVDVLNYGVSELDQQTSERLLAARRKAIAAMAQPAYVAPAETNLAGVGRYISEHLHGHHAWMPTALVISAALLVLVVLQQNYSEPVEADALLLASDLPPEAYVDKGFDAWLENTSRR